MICTGFIAMMALDRIGTGYVEFNSATAFPRSSLEVLTRALNSSLGTECWAYFL